jgi:hypothetical protein
MKKVLIISILLAVLGVSFLINPTESKTKSYYSGEAISFNGKVYVGTTNTGKFELFTLENSQLVKKIAVQSLDRESAEFYDLHFDRENGKLYVYLVNGRYLYKYDVTNPAVPALALKIKDNSWDWFSRVDKVNGKLITIGSKGTKIWNRDMQVIDSYSMINNSTMGAAQFSQAGNFVFNLKDKLSIYNTASREKVAEYAIAVNDKQASRGLVSDSDSNLIYVVDDKSLKAINFEGQVVREFKHVSNAGYDVAVSAVNPNYLYFSDGLGVVKVDKETMKPVDWSWTIRTAPAGSWAMGLAIAADAAGDKIVVFNGSNILVLDQKMNQLGSYSAVEIDVNPVEPLSLSADKNFGAPGTQVSLRGTGFGLSEDLDIKFGGILVSQIKADENGRFAAIITVPTPAIHPAPADIKVIGKSSGKTYSISFRIE